MDYANTTQDPDVMLERRRKEEVIGIIQKKTLVWKTFKKGKYEYDYINDKSIGKRTAVVRGGT